MHMELRQSLFWDVDPKKIDLDKNARYVIERVLDFGNDKETKWMYRTFSHALIREVLEHSRVLQPKTRVLWNELMKV